MKIVGFSQLRNELEKGNLENWFKCMSVCDFIYIFDQNSTDGSLEYYKRFNNVVVIESPVNRFHEELLCKQELLNKIKTDHPDTNYILWMDGDEILDGRLLKDQVFRDMCNELWPDPFQGYLFGHKNLWRSDVHERLDDGFAGMDGAGVCRLWKFNMNLSFNGNPGLHQDQFPVNLNKKRLDFSLIHRGFSTDYQIMTRYDVYKSYGQSGWELERLLNESSLTVQKINYELLLSWFEIKDDMDPTTKRKIRDIYNETKH
jgi:hypothetical protein